jgi:hypothetical protein
MNLVNPSLRPWTQVALTSLEYPMNMSFVAPLALALFTTTAAVRAAEPPQHDEHHPAAQVAKSTTAKPAEPAAKIDMQMKSMRDLHDKMLNAKTADERKALMDEHMKSMRDGMSMMNGMMPPGATKAMPAPSMQKQMDMMKMMMQMMMDRMDAAEK